MPLTGAAKAQYMREYHRRRNAGTSGVPRCGFCDEPGSHDRLLVGDQDAIICEECITLAVARVAEARGQ